jgi:hypothetical protein
MELHENNIGFLKFHISAAVGQKNGQFNRKRNFEKANNESSSGGL